jgi:endonuclease YncB( thermonuclease family)
MGNCCVTSDHVEDLYRERTDENTPYFSYEDVRMVVKVVRVIDGDTIAIVMKQEGTNKIYKYRVRLYGIDTPESRPPRDQPNREEEIAASFRAKAALIHKLAEVNHYVTIHFHQYDKYGRLLGTIYGKDGVNLNQWMITNHYAFSYDGKTKKIFEPQVPLAQPIAPLAEPPVHLAKPLVFVANTILASINQR